MDYRYFMKKALDQAEDALAEVERNRIWLETKIMRQLNALMSQSAGEARDVANLNGINTGQIAKDLGLNNPEVLGLCVRSFNSFLRTTINAQDARTAYYLMDRYREVAEHLELDNALFVAVAEEGLLYNVEIDLARGDQEYGPIGGNFAKLRVGVHSMVKSALAQIRMA